MDVTAIGSVTDPISTIAQAQVFYPSVHRSFSTPAQDLSAAVRQDEFVHAPADPSARGLWKLSDVHAVSELMRQRSSAHAALKSERDQEAQAAAVSAEASTAERGLPAIAAVRASQLAAWRRNQTRSREGSERSPRRQHGDEAPAAPAKGPRYL
jgi:hypothetical protein